MIHPLVPFAIRGAIWYQGESNLGDGMLYFEKMKALIMGWRSVWNEGDFAFYYVQLAPFHYNNSKPTLLPLMWEAQTDALSIPDTGMAVINDIGNLKNIHPTDKQDVGKRLALWALAKNYGKQIVYSGPLYKSMDVDGSKHPREVQRYRRRTSRPRWKTAHVVHHCRRGQKIRRCGRQD